METPTTSDGDHHIPALDSPPSPASVAVRMRKARRSILFRRLDVTDHDQRPSMA